MADKKRGPLLKYDRNDLVNAVNAVKNGSMSVRRAAAEFNVPKSTLGDKVSGRSDVESKMGRPPALPESVEGNIVENVLEASKRGMGISRRQLFARTAILCRKMKATPFKKALPSRGWWEGVKRRHPEITIRKPEKLGNSRARMLNPVVVERYFNDLTEIITNLNLQNSPQNIWNCDETGKQFQHTPVKIISQKGARNVVSRVSENRTNITIMACVNGVGDKMSPMVVVKGKTSASLHGMNVTEAPEGTIWGYQESGWMTEELGERWFRDVFLKQCGPERPQLLLLDGHSSHETLGILEMAVANHIHVFCLPPHTTHMLQPLDRSVFGPFNRAYNQACSEFLAESAYHVVNKGSFPQLFKKAWDVGVSPNNIVSGFKACGIVPLNPQAVPAAAYQPSVATDLPHKSDNRIPIATTATSTSPMSSVPVTVSSLASSVHVVPSVSSTAISSDSNTRVSTTTASTSSMPFPSAPVSLIGPFASSASTVSSVSSFTGLEGPSSHLSASPDASVPIPSPSNGISMLSVNPLSIEEPETILSLIASNDIQVACADSYGVANFAIPDTVSTSTTETSIWNTEIDSIFLPVTKNEIIHRSTKSKTVHRLLTSQAIIEEKREAIRKRELKEEKKSEREKIKKEKLANKQKK
ncbi:tigger transposable element-derived protein 6-like [Argopecten irradians]|uniref:tigger transposable element-derived protein 6-like n=1 Tax=Argopecten irradians TaxID=31199 RepID=UPI00371ECB52